MKKKDTAEVVRIKWLRLFLKSAKTILMSYVYV
jgi:hypothetical protein